MGLAEKPMACSVTELVLGWMTVAWNSNASSVFLPATSWVSADGVTGAKGWGEMRGRNGQITATPAVQLTNDVHDPPTTATAVGATMSADGPSDPNGTTALSTGGYRYARGGWIVTLSSTTTLSTAVVAGGIALIRA
jgi:hypothetical protein